ncbi:hypothetical protein QMG83_00660 [Salinibacterium sp. G-O1]|uniref:hypothetical protein n=1 Tax=Salinibacterium sp. G-O1 TaxID=3046208 RepID=UPI0024BAFE3F|nr:hypothetical protein [Salinibacterium sp. G-O1]MDJ0333726.1 hypothetical protein [Salinibacterium sp. G-O1]
MRRAIITWTVVAAVVLGAFAGTVVILNSTLYSASGFVRSYLDALSSKNAPVALELAGSGQRSTASRAMLDPAAMGDLENIQFISESSFAYGIQRVVFSYVAGGRPGQSSFDVQRTGNVLGLFSSWTFATAPYSVVQMSVLNSQDFTANGVDLTTPEQGTVVPLVVFTPSAITITHESKFLTANPLIVVAAQPGASVVAALDVRANSALVAAVQGKVDDLLDTCTTQTVLLPTGCPFGQQISNRIVSTPQWSMSEYPAVRLIPGSEPATWLMPVTNGAAHLTVDVQSLFDGTTSSFDEDVPFTVSYLVTFLSNDDVLITAQR